MSDLTHEPDPTPALLDIWRELLGSESAGVDDDFFDLGGNSLIAVSLVYEIQERLGRTVSLATLFRYRTVRGLAIAMGSPADPDQHRDRDGEGPGAADPTEAIHLPPLVPRPCWPSYRISFPQESILRYVGSVADPDGFYAGGVGIRITGDLDTARLAHAVDETVHRHDSLRSVLHGEPMTACSEVLPEGIATEVIAVDRIPPRDDELWRLHGPARIKPDQEPCFRARIVTSGPEHALLIRSHKAVMDGTSLSIVARDVASRYAGDPGPSRPGVTYADFARWQRDWLRGPVRDAFMRYWRGALGGAERLPLPCRDEGVLGGDLRTSTTTASLDRERAAGIASIRKAGFSAHTIAVGAFAIAASRLWGVRDVVTGSSTANRALPDFAEVVGFFANSILVRAAVPARIDAGYLPTVRGAIAGALDYQHVQYDDVLDWTDRGLYDVKVSATGGGKAPGGLAGMRLGGTAVQAADEPAPVRLARRPLYVTLDEGNDADYTVAVEYRMAGLDEDIARALLSGMLEALAELATVQAA